MMNLTKGMYFVEMAPYDILSLILAVSYVIVFKLNYKEHRIKKNSGIKKGKRK